MIELKIIVIHKSLSNDSKCQMTDNLYIKIQKHINAAMRPKITVEDSENRLLENVTHMYYVSMYIYYTLCTQDI